MTKAETKMKILSGINPKQYFPDAKHIIVYAFTLGDRHYFRYDDPLNTPYDRAMKTLVYYKELDMNVDRKYLKAHTMAIDNLFVRETLTINELMEIKRLNDHMKLRLQLPKEPELMYKLAAVVFFDQFENPTVYEFKYGEKKIEFWKKNTSLTDFFLQRPLVELIPYLASAGENLETFSRLAEKKAQQHLDNLLPLLSEEQKMILSGKSD